MLSGKTPQFHEWKKGDIECTISIFIQPCRTFNQECDILRISLLSVILSVNDTFFISHRQKGNQSFDLADCLVNSRLCMIAVSCQAHIGIHSEYFPCNGCVTRMGYFRIV